MPLVHRALMAAGITASVVGLVAVVAVPLTRGASAETFVASVPWSSAVVSSEHGRTLTVLGDVEGMDDRFDCGPAVRTKVSETAHSVVIRVDVYRKPLPPGVGCGGVGLVAVPATIHLRTALGARSLVDGMDDRVHPALVVDRTPALSSVPTPFTRRSTGWDESTGQVHEWWRWQNHHQAQQIDLDLSPTATATSGGTPLGGATLVIVGTSTARVWRDVDGDTVSSTVLWSPEAGRTYRLSVSDQALHPMSAADVVDLARSVR